MITAKAITFRRAATMRINLGCGHDIKDGWINIDSQENEGVDQVINLDQSKLNLPFDDNSVTEIYASHFLEHIHNILPLMQELYRIAAPNCLFTAKTPHASSDDAFGDPTHCRFFVVDSYLAFGQPYYWRADYGYTADWKMTDCLLSLRVTKDQLEPLSDIEVNELINTRRNMIAEIEATMIAQKPARKRDRQILMADAPKIKIRPRKDAVYTGNV